MLTWTIHSSISINFFYITCYSFNKHIIRSTAVELLMLGWKQTHFDKCNLANIILNGFGWNKKNEKEEAIPSRKKRSIFFSSSFFSRFLDQMRFYLSLENWLVNNFFFFHLTAKLKNLLYYSNRGWNKTMKISSNVTCTI